MKIWHYYKTDTMPISYTIIMIKSAGAKFPPEYSDRNLIVKTQCVKHMWLSGNCRTFPFVSVLSKTQLAQLIQSSLQHSTVVAVFLCVLLLLYLPLSLSLIFILQNWAYYLTCPLTLNILRMSVLNSSYESFIGIMGFRIAKLYCLK